MTNEKNAVGSEIVSRCTKCRQPLAHTIAAMAGARIAKVQCRTCGGLHRYIDPDAPLKPSRKRAVKAPFDEGVAWQKMIDLVASKKKIPYAISGDFKQHDLIDHSSFGLGVVTHLLPDDKIKVTFKEGEKVLVARR